MSKLEQLMTKYGYTRAMQGMEVRKMGRDQYSVGSETRPEIEHVVDLEGDMAKCSCEAATFGAICCKHEKKVKFLQEAGLLPKDITK